MQSLVIGGVIGGIAGIMLAIDRQFVEPKNFESSLTFLAYAALDPRRPGAHLRPDPRLDHVLVHRSARARPSCARRSTTASSASTASFEPKDVGPLRFMLVGLLIMLLVIFRPQGILGSREEVMLGELAR